MNVRPLRDMATRYCGRRQIPSSASALRSPTSSRISSTQLGAAERRRVLRQLKRRAAHRRQRRARLVQAAAAGEAVRELVVPAQVPLTLQPAQQDLLAAELRREVQEQGRYALELDALAVEPAQ